MRVLLVEDDTRLLETLAAQMRKAGFAVDASADGEEGLYLGDEFPIDIAIIDLGLPQLSGLDLIRKLRENGRNFPILVLTARTEWQDKVNGLEAGADDYLTKPFHPEELMARVNALLRRAGGHAQPNVQLGPISVDLTSQRVRLEGEEVELTTYEFKVLQYLIMHPDEVVTKTVRTHLRGGCRSRQQRDRGVHRSPASQARSLGRTQTHRDPARQRVPPGAQARPRGPLKP